MKTKPSSLLKFSALLMSLAAFGPPAKAQLIIPNADGSDGILIVSNSLVIDLSQAGTGPWTGTSGSPGKGTYDPSQWAVVFKYSSVVISNGATLSFANHATHAPVVWLVSSNVTINGELWLDGQPTSSDPVHLPEPGPGGFRGGGGPTYGAGNGFGPAGGAPNNSSGFYAGYYGNPQILPLIGGSGGGGYGGGANGAAGGGAILIAASGTIAVNNYVHANGGNGYYQDGSGGAIRLVANQIQGSGTIQALGGTSGGVGGIGRIRLEGNTVTNGLFVNPNSGTVQPANPAVIFPPNNAPVVNIVNIGGVSSASFPDPKAAMNSSGNDDVVLSTTNSVTIQLQTLNFPTNGVLNVYIKPRNAPQTILQAVFDSGTTNLANWHVTALPGVVNYGANQGHTVIQARAAY
jgi:hypothetical protein